MCRSLYSFPDVFWEQLAKLENTPTLRLIEARYFDLIRNLPVLVYQFIFGARLPFATASLKAETMSLNHLTRAVYICRLRLRSEWQSGLSEDAQRALEVSYKDLASYVEVWQREYNQLPGYEAMGVKSEAGEYVQLNDCILQSEAEFYSAIRAKRVAPSGQTAKSDDGVIIEVPMDLNFRTIRHQSGYRQIWILSTSTA